MEGKEPGHRSGEARPPRSRAVSLAGGFRSGIGWRMWASVTVEDWLRHLVRAVALESERRTWFNWLPVAFGLGIGAFFAADREPLWWGPPLAIAIFAAAAWRMRAAPLPHFALLAFCAASAGLLAANWRTERISAPTLERVTIGRLAGFVEAIEERTGDMRMVLLVTSLGDLAPENTPRRVRVTARKTLLLAGEHVAFNARLMPPPEAVRPGGYDFARDAFFRGIGAVGSGTGRIERTPAPHEPPLLVRFNAVVDAARNAMTERIANLIGGQAGAVAAALVTGKRGLISEETNDILRGAGLYHIVSISGLHMVLAAGAIFWLVRAILALSAAAALGWPLKKIAALLSMLGASAYCIFSGSEVATERSLVMTLIMLGAILVDRPALSMRNLALAALVVLALEPEALLGPSFQMSFGAVGALIAYAEWQRRQSRTDVAEPGLIARMIRSVRFAVVGLFVTSVLATAATSPFAAFHFQTYNPFGLIGNMLALPFVSLVVMPAAVIGALLYPLGLDAAAWWVMGLATAPVLAVSRFVSDLGGSTQVVPAYSLTAVICLAFALASFTLLSTWIRLAGILPLALGVGLAAARPDRADVYIDREAAGVAARSAAGTLATMGRPGSFVLAQWLKADGDSRPADDPTLGAGAQCDPIGCVVTLVSGHSIAWSRDPLAVSEDCARADLVVTPLRWDGACAALMIDRHTLDRFGSMSIKATPQGLVARTSRNPDSPRPWSRRQGQAAARQPALAAAEAPAVSSDEPD